MDKFLDFLNSTSVVLTIATLLIIGFSRAVIKIFNMGVNFKSNLASHKELIEFESEIKKDMRGYAVQIQKSVMDACLKVIEAKLSNIEEIQKTAVDIKVMKTELESEMKHTMEKYDEIKSVADSVRTLNNKVQRLEFNSETKNMTRRTEK